MASGYVINFFSRDGHTIKVEKIVQEDTQACGAILALLVKGHHQRNTRTRGRQTLQMNSIHTHESENQKSSLNI